MAKANGYNGESNSGAKEWLRAKSKGLDLSQKAIKQRLNDMEFNTKEIFYHGTMGDINHSIQTSYLSAHHLNQPMKWVHDLT